MNSECQAYSREDPRPHPVARIGAAIEVLREKLLALGMREEVLQQRIEMRPA